jgi:predicted dehydrogenase
MTERRRTHSRREFLGATGRTLAASAAAWGFRAIVAAWVLGAAAPSNRIRVGQIGCGRIANGHDMPGVVRSGLADIVAVCDVDTKRAANGKVVAETLQREAGSTVPAITVYRDHRELLGRADIDAVVISTPEHWHAELGIAAARAGKHILVEKPMTLTLADADELIAAVIHLARAARNR